MKDLLLGFTSNTYNFDLSEVRQQMSTIDTFRWF